jgi:hypothetical protein
VVRPHRIYRGKRSADKVARNDGDTEMARYVVDSWHVVEVQTKRCFKVGQIIDEEVSGMYSTTWEFRNTYKTIIKAEGKRAVSNHRHRQKDKIK